MKTMKHKPNKLRGEVFEPHIRKIIEKGVVKLINDEKSLMSINTLNSPRAVGDAIQELLEANFSSIIPQQILGEYNSSFARRSMADFAFTDSNNYYYIVDTKTHNLDTDFNMPNLTSVERLSRFYEDDRNFFAVLFISYRVKGKRIIAKNCYFAPIEYLDWSCLTIGALGWGQIQIANANNIVIKKSTRKKWMLKLCERLFEFYPKEIGKINDRIKHFEKVRLFWENHLNI
jgi:hypothetical protein